MRRLTPPQALWLFFISTLFPSVTSAQFELSTDGLPNGPGIVSYTESLDFGDVDLDGDWDVVFADGGDFGNDQNRIWINSGGLQGGVEGAFSDETATRLPLMSDTSRDIEFADLDGDGDLEVFTANSAQITNQSARIWINSGGLQGGQLGFFADETAQRWVGLAQPGSSMPPFQVLPGGGYIAWSADADFADLDNDGDLDLIHTSYGSSFGGGPPTRLFTNDGHGFFTEFNPSGVQLAGLSIPDGTPALWASGTQLSGSTDTTGAFADVSSVSQDVEIGDIDGDFDLDFLLGDLNGTPRLFRNRLEEQGGVLGFRDVTFEAFPSGFSSGSFLWDQEFADLDGDGDLDLYASDWLEQGGPPFGFLDRVFEGDGAGGFSLLQSPVPGSSGESEEVDFVDFDGDGDLDPVLAPFSGDNFLYENDGTGLMSLAGKSMDLPTLHDIEACDLDGDGDYDLMIGAEQSINAVLLNTTQVPDTTAPWFAGVEPQADSVAEPGAFALRAAVGDNTAFELFEALDVAAQVRVGGCLAGEFSAVHSGAQIFRTELPANWLGEIELTWRATDLLGNTSSAAPLTYTATSALDVSNSFGAGTASSVTGLEPGLECGTVPFAGTSLALCLRGAANSDYLLGVFTAAAPAPVSLPGIGLVNVTGAQLVFVSGQLDDEGRGLWSTALPPVLPPGLEVFAQAFTAEGSVGGDLFASTQGLAIRTF